MTAKQQALIDMSSGGQSIEQPHQLPIKLRRDVVAY